MALQKTIDGFVLAGGRSSRMGQDKALMQVEGTPLVWRAAKALQPFVNQVTLLAPAGRYEGLALPLVADRWPDQGPLGAICTGLLSTEAEWSVFLACDLPLVSRKFLQLLVDRIHATKSDAVVPRTADGWQPLSAAYHSRCRTPFERAFEAGRRSVIQLLEEIPVEAITRDEMAQAGLHQHELANMNTPEDWARLAATRKGGR